MLEDYKNSYKDLTNQILIISSTGTIVHAKSIFFNAVENKNITELHPFFETLTSLLSQPNQTFSFECVNINDSTLDFKLHTQAENEPSVLVFHDLTNQYIAYQKAAQKRNEAAIKSQLIDYQNKLLAEKEAFKNNFIANFSHEIRMPINTINGFATLLENTNLEQNQRYNLNIVKNSSDKLKTMINDILDISKIETNHFPLYNIRYDLIEELNILVEIYSRKCNEKGLTLQYHIDPECPKFVEADKYRLAQIANNLIGNAIKFTTNGSVSLQVNCIAKDSDKATLAFVVKDTGIGMKKSHLESIFKGFYQISNNIRNNGFGLGLAITSKLVKALHGDIQVESEIGKGSTFTTTITFNISKNQVSEQKTETVTKNSKANLYKILLAEPLEKDKKALTTILSRIKNCDITFVETGDEVIEALYKDTYHLVMLNLNLPTMDGLDTARYIRHTEFEIFNSIPIMVISDYPSKEEEKYCKERRINSYIGKPFNKEEILRKVKYIQQKKQA